MIKINASIVCYNNKKEQLIKVINNFLKTELQVKLYVVDNSSNDDLRFITNLDNRVEYIFNNANIGYGSAHNIVIKKSIEGNIPYHLVMNPDIYFKQGVLEELYNYLESHPNVGNVMPKVIYPNGEIQYLCKLLPTPMDLIVRRFIPLKKLKETMNKKYELRWTGYNREMNVPVLSGCFMFLRVKALKYIGLFDENIFMYLEDVDLNRRINKVYKTIYYPNINIFHEYGKESYKNIKNLKHHIKSSIYYFNKWGWFFDKERKEINCRCIQDIKKGGGFP